MGRKVMFTFILTFLGVPVSQSGTIVFERMLRLQKALQPEEWTEVTLPDNRWKWRCQHRWSDGWRSCDIGTIQPTFPLFLFFPSCFCATSHLYVFVSWQQEFASRLHYHVVREYIGQLMKNNYSCKNRKHEKAAAKIRLQWDDLRDLFQEMVINCLKNKQQLFHITQQLLNHFNWLWKWNPFEKNRFHPKSFFHFISDYKTVKMIRGAFLS